MAVALSPDGRRLLVVNTGRTQSLALVDTESRQTIQRLAFDRPRALSGGVTYAPDGKRAYVAGGGSGKVWRYAVHSGGLSQLKPLELPPIVQRGEVAKGMTVPYPAGLAVSGDGRRLFVADNLGEALHVIDVATGRSWSVPVGARPQAVAMCPDDSCAYVANSGERTVSVVDLATRRLRSVISVGTHPTSLVHHPHLDELYVANADQDTVSVIDTATARVVRTVAITTPDHPHAGHGPVALTVDPRRRRLYVAAAGDNALTVIGLASRGHGHRVLGRIPTAWYPSAVAISSDGARLLVANAKGMPRRGDRVISTEGTLSFIDSPSVRGLARHSAVAGANNRCLPRCRSADMLKPLRKRIAHVIYVIKENRSYDDLFADLGPKHRATPRFGDDVAPNHRALARRFVLFDNFHALGSVSVDGKNWSLGGYANHYVEQNWPATYSFRNRPSDYLGDSRASAPGDNPRQGYLWDALERSGRSYRNYGVWANGGVPVKMPRTEWHLAANTDANYPGYNRRLSDQRRVSAFLQEFRAFEATGELPDFIFMSLPNDHLLGRGPGYRTPEAMMADNDLALGRIVDAVSHSVFWPQTAIFVVDDDPQGGDAAGSRTVALVVSPYTQRGRVDSTPYTTASMLRTMESILGLPPLSQFDASATAMHTAFEPSAPVFRPYDAIVPRQDLSQLNPGKDNFVRGLSVGLFLGLGIGAGVAVTATKRSRRRARVG